ncbi:MAG: hypothetical protein ISR59_06675 [Anaerolineales bacterium]|uniref:Uncharacterized protein n=1 Tax=Candidatus Desulfolinea nitratireducens TaxID=2841698 RepID=A0A8J6NFG6_9CHLR|nr:hypothetical protein [Candidatus Desulfolinea nitratireducens]MBL6960776.1 hypothetical protein [Anaerolineales bacterium]
MRIARKLNVDREIIKGFNAVLGNGMIELSSNKLARPEFFILAHKFISEFIEGGLFKKEALVIKALEDFGFPTDNGPISFILSEQKKSREASLQMVGAAKAWQAGDEVARKDVGWAASEFTTTMREHLERLKTLIFPLLEQNFSIEDEHNFSEKFDTIVYEADGQNAPDKYEKLIVMLKEEIEDWR